MNKALIGWTVLETRWRFLIGLILMSLSTIGSVLSYPGIAEMLPAAISIDAETRLGRALEESLKLTATFPGFIWSELYSQSLAEMTVLFAALLGTGAQFLPGAGRSTHYLLSLPVTRRQLLTHRIVVGLAELLLLTLVSTVLVSLMAPIIDEQFPVGRALVHGVSLFFGGAVFFAMAIYLSTVFEDPWRPLLITCGTAFVLALSLIVAELPGQFAVLSARTFFESGSLPWSGWLISVLVTAALIFTGSTALQRQNF